MRNPSDSANTPSPTAFLPRACTRYPPPCTMGWSTGKMTLTPPAGSISASMAIQAVSGTSVLSKESPAVCGFTTRTSKSPTSVSGSSNAKRVCTCVVFAVKSTSMTLGPSRGLSRTVGAVRSTRMPSVLHVVVASVPDVTRTVK